MNLQIEREEVLMPCIKLCRQLKIQGYILKWRRLDSLDYYHEDGDPDIEIWFPRDGNVWILMAECKKPMGGRMLRSQIAYRNRYKKFNNIIYFVVRSVEQLKQMIEAFSDFKVEELNELRKDSI